MTKGEAKQKFRENDTVPLLEQKSISEIIDEIYDDFEQELQIATSGKTCTGCKKYLPLKEIK